jgi:hypothetical protein
MSISIVNGYMCASCADVAKARRGEDPAKSEDAASAAPTRLSASLEAARRKAAGADETGLPGAVAPTDAGRMSDGRVDIRV